MKKTLLLLLTLVSFASFAAPWDIKCKKFTARSAWDYPIQKNEKRFLQLSLCTLTIIDATHVVCRIITVGPDMTRTWRFLVEAHAYEWTGTRLEEVYNHWEFDLPNGYMVYDYYVTLPRVTSWATWPASPEAVWDEEFYVYEYFPIN